MILGVNPFFQMGLRMLCQYVKSSSPIGIGEALQNVCCFGVSHLRFPTKGPNFGPCAAGSCELSRKAVDIWAGAYGSEARIVVIAGKAVCSKKSYGKTKKAAMLASLSGIIAWLYHMFLVRLVHFTIKFTT